METEVSFYRSFIVLFFSWKLSIKLWVETALNDDKYIFLEEENLSIFLVSDFRFALKFY